MAEHSPDPRNEDREDENPLETLAADLSASLEGERVEVNESSVGQVRGGQVNLRNSAARAVSAHALSMEDSGAVLVRSDSLEMHDCAAVVAVGRTVSMTESNTSLVAGQHVHARNVRSVMVVAGRVDGDVKAVLSFQAALALGAGLGIVLLLGRRLWQRVLSKQS